MDQVMLIAAGVVVVVLLLLALGTRAVKPFERVVVFRLGKADESSVRGPGLVFLIPAVDLGVTVDLREQLRTVSSQAVTRDNATVGLEVELSWRVTDPLMYVLSNATGALEEVTQTTLREIVGELRLDELLSQRVQVTDQFRDAFATITARWGLQVTRLYMGEIVPLTGGRDGGRPALPGDPGASPASSSS